MKTATIITNGNVSMVINTEAPKSSELNRFRELGANISRTGFYYLLAGTKECVNGFKVEEKVEETPVKLSVPEQAKIRLADLKSELENSSIKSTVELKYNKSKNETKLVVKLSNCLLDILFKLGTFKAVVNTGKNFNVSVLDEFKDIEVKKYYVKLGSFESVDAIVTLINTLEGAE